MEKILVFDIGGTWVRSAIYLEKNQLYEIKKIRLVLDGSEPKQKLIQLIDIIKNTTIQFDQNHLFDTIAVSFGACMNHINGEVFFAAPIFGAKRIGINFEQLLKNNIQNKNIYVVNDVSALCFGYDALNISNGLNQFAALTISSGIALRRYDATLKRVFYDSSYGIQGEIGHQTLYNRYNFTGDNFLKCDCGGEGHFASFSSGHAIDNLFRNYLLQKKDFLESPLYSNYRKTNLAITALHETLKSDYQSVEYVLDFIAYPIANAISIIFCMCPDIDKLFISGGVVETLNKYLKEKIIRMLSQVTYVYDQEFYHSRINFISNDLNLGLIGAGYYGYLKEGTISNQ